MQSDPSMQGIPADGCACAVKHSHAQQMPVTVQLPGVNTTAYEGDASTNIVAYGWAHE